MFDVYLNIWLSDIHWIWQPCYTSNGSTLFIFWRFCSEMHLWKPIKSDNKVIHPMALPHRFSNILVVKFIYKNPTTMLYIWRIYFVYFFMSLQWKPSHFQLLWSVIHLICDINFKIVGVEDSTGECEKFNEAITLLDIRGI